MHTSLLLNPQFLENNREQANRVLERSGVYWALGRLDAINRDAIVAGVRRLAKSVLPTLYAQIRSILVDARPKLKERAPEGLLTLARNTVNTSERRTEALKLMQDELEKSCEPLVTELEEKISGQVDTFVQSSQEVKQFLGRAAQAQTAPTPRNPRSQSSHRSSANGLGKGLIMSALQPAAGGKAHKLELVPVVFGLSKPLHRTDIDFETLLVGVERELDAFKQKVVDKILEAINRMLRNIAKKSSNRVSVLRSDSATGGSNAGANAGGSAANEGGGGNCSIRGEETEAVDGNVVVLSLKRSFVSSMEYSLTCRTSPDAFYGAKQNKFSLKLRANVPDELNKRAAEACSDALRSTTLRLLPPKYDVETVLNDVEKTFDDARKEWRSRLASSLKELLRAQTHALKNELNGNSKGLLIRSLREFLRHVLTTEWIRNSTENFAKVSSLLEEVENAANQLHLLWIRAEKEADPVLLGMAMSERFDNERARATALANSTVEYTLPPVPNRSMLRFALQEQDRSEVFRDKTSIFECGSDSALDDLTRRVKTRYKLDLEHAPSQSVFASAATLMWSTATNHKHPPEMQLRAFIVSKMLQSFDTQADKRSLEERLDGKATVAVYRMWLQSKNYSGDLLCLYNIAKEFRKNFFVWLPGTSRPLKIVFHPATYCRFYHLAVTGYARAGQEPKLAFHALRRKYD
eukprot:6182528-Pleurochrysis_carterae.AAC.2